jgi:hypothetical protein
MPGSFDLLSIAIDAFDQNEHTAAMITPAQNINHKVEQGRKWQ